jgi:hypothetical protein
MTAPWAQVRELFEAALDQPSPADWLARQQLDSDVRREVASLLDHHSRAGAFLDQPIVDTVPALLEEEPILDEGTVVGHYKIGRELGRGAMGRVYLATDTRLGRAVALKALAPHLTGDASHRERLRREARAAASLTHSGICTVYALEEIGGQLFIASELVDGHTLRDEISRGDRPSADAVAATARELAEGLASAHAKGITHRDFKPENVMRHADGRLKILDFGLARFETAAADGASVRATVVGALVGTPAYMSPEQLNGQPADARSDVFAYGVVVYEYATGVHPFHASTSLGLAARVLEGEADPIATRSRSVPDAVAAVVDRCLQKAPIARFATAADVVSALRSPSASAPSRFLSMWRLHQIVTMVLYVAAAWVTWRIKEFYKPNPMLLAVFVALGIGAASAGVMRGHLLFTSALNVAHLPSERRRLRPVIVAIDLMMSAGCALAGLMLSIERPLTGVLTIALAIGLALATTLIEPATTHAAFDR